MIRCILPTLQHLLAPLQRNYSLKEEGLPCFIITMVGSSFSNHIDLVLMSFYETGSLKAQVTVPVDFNFENSVNIIDGEDKIMFLDFVSRMLKWHPEERSTARDLLSDPWLEADFP